MTVNEFISEMAQLYKRIEQGTASDIERIEFDMKTNNSCIDYKLLISLIKKVAKEDKTNI